MPFSLGFPAQGLICRCRGFPTGPSTLIFLFPLFFWLFSVIPDSSFHLYFFLAWLLFFNLLFLFFFLSFEKNKNFES